MRIAVMGCGKMAGAIVQRWLNCGAVDAADCVALEVSEQRASDVRARLQIESVTDARAAVAGAEMLLLGIKPQQAAEVLPRWAPLLGDQLVVSMLAGTQSSAIANLLGGGVEVTRIMPNTPARIGLGCTAVAWPTPTQRSKPALLPLFEALGAVVQLDESQIDAFTSIAGSGPAYVFLFLEALQSAAQAQGFAPAAAREMAMTTVLGAATLAATEKKSFAALRADVTSPGGTTEAAIGVLQHRGFEALWREATQTATERAAQLREHAHVTKQ